jgi:hypothetical protein
MMAVGQGKGGGKGMEIKIVGESATANSGVGNRGEVVAE